MITNNKKLVVCIVCLFSSQAHAAEFKSEDGLIANVTGAVTFGTQIRMEDPSPDVYGDWPAKSVHTVDPGKLQGYTGGSDLNYAKHRPIATVVRGVVNVDVKKGNFGFFVRGAAWKDFVNGEGRVAYGSYPNGFISDTSLRDKGFTTSSKFSAYQILDYYLSGKFDFESGHSIDARLGRQVLSWGSSQLIGGGINAAINPIKKGNNTGYR